MIIMSQSGSRLPLLRLAEILDAVAFSRSGQTLAEAPRIHCKGRPRPVFHSSHAGAWVELACILLLLLMTSKANNAMHTPLQINIDPQNRGGARFPLRDLLLGSILSCKELQAFFWSEPCEEPRWKPPVEGETMGVMTYQARFSMFRMGMFLGGPKSETISHVGFNARSVYLKRRKGVEAKGDVRFRVGGIGKLFPSRNLALHPF